MNVSLQSQIMQLKEHLVRLHVKCALQYMDDRGDDEVVCSVAGDTRKEDIIGIISKALPFIQPHWSLYLNLTDLEVSMSAALYVQQLAGYSIQRDM
jgi:hypothetical protein